jgi:uncharacterized lipoprotein
MKIVAIVLAVTAVMSGCVSRTVERQTVVDQPRPGSTVVVPQGATAPSSGTTVVVPQSAPPPSSDTTIIVPSR